MVEAKPKPKRRRKKGKKKPLRLTPQGYNQRESITDIAIFFHSRFDHICPYEVFHKAKDFEVLLEDCHEKCVGQNLECWKYVLRLLKKGLDNGIRIEPGDLPESD